MAAVCFQTLRTNCAFKYAFIGWFSMNKLPSIWVTFPSWSPFPPGHLPSGSSINLSHPYIWVSLCWSHFFVMLFGSHCLGHIVGHIVWVTLCVSHFVGHILLITLCGSHLVVTLYRSHCAHHIVWVKLHSLHCVGRLMYVIVTLSYLTNMTSCQGVRVKM